MPTSLLVESLTGSVFGAALAASGVWLPSVIRDQLRLQSFQMIQVMLFASASSALVMSLLDWTNYARKKIRPAASLGLFPYDGNVLGGVIFGVGMALAGACPGTVIVQLAAGLPTAPYIALGGVMGAMLYLPLKSYIGRTYAAHRQSVVHRRSASETIPAVTGLSETTILLIWEVACFGALGILEAYASPDDRLEAAMVTPAVGGWLIGTAQAIAIGLAGHPVGVSTVYEDVAKWILRPVLPEKTASSATLVTAPAAFASGIFAGSAVLFLRGGASFSHASLAAISPGQAIEALSAGLLLVFGARLAGGCTSGHSISGLAAFSTSSFVTTIAMFAAGVLILGRSR